MSAEVRPTSYRIGDLTLDLERRSVRRRAEPLPCGRLTFELLVLLAERAPSVVAREELVERLWQGRYVSSATVKQRVSLLRQALGDRADDPKYVRVVRGQGYALVPSVHPVYAKPARPARWKRYGLAAGALLAAFVVGAEVGYRDGLKPQIPDVDRSVSVLVTSWPLASTDTAEWDHDALPQEDYHFVLGMAERVLAVLEDDGLADKIHRAYALGEDADRDGSLSVVANASVREREAISVRVTVLNESLNDARLARLYEIESWSRALQKLPERERASSRLARHTGPRIRPALVPENGIRVFVPNRSDDGRFMLVANFYFDRSAIDERPSATQTDAARLIAMTIDDELPMTEP